jgi:hypothetical protein
MIGRPRGQDDDPDEGTMRKRGRTSVSASALPSHVLSFAGNVSCLRDISRSDADVGTFMCTPQLYNHMVTSEMWEL